jgi:hypothetical protein
MGTLTPGAKYVYEREGGRTYARIMGETERKLIGEDYNLDLKRRSIEIADEWVPIVQAAEQNPALQAALEHAKMLYLLSKDYNGQAEHSK